MLKPKSKQPTDKKAEAEQKPKEKLAAPAIAKARPKITRVDH